MVFTFSDCAAKRKPCPWEPGQVANPLSLFEKHQNPPWSMIEMSGNPDIAGLGILISLAVTTLLFLAIQILFRIHIVRHRYDSPVQKKHFVKSKYTAILSNTLLSLEDTLLVTGWALFAALQTQRCDISIYHLTLLSWLFAATISAGSVIFWSSSHVFGRAIRRWFRGDAHDAGGKDAPRKRSLLVEALRTFGFLSLLVVHGAVLGQLMHTSSAQFPQPAMAAPAFCFFSSKYPHAFNDYLNLYPFPLLVALITFLAPLLAWLLAAAVYFLWTSYIATGSAGSKRPGGGRAALRTIFQGLISFIGGAVAIFFTFRYWNNAQKYLEPSTNEATWGFGQVVAVVLLILPVLALVEAICGSDKLRVQNAGLSIPLETVDNYQRVHA